jgi:hypothetical protein
MASSIQRTEALSRVLRIYLDYTLASAREILRKVEEERECLALDGDEENCWADAVGAAKLMVRSTECCISDEQEGRMLGSGLIGLVVLSRAEESLRSGLQAARCTWGFGRDQPMRLSQTLRQSASLYTKVLIAARAKESELSALYQSAANVTDTLARVSDCCKIQEMVLPPLSYSLPKQHIERYKAMLADPGAAEEMKYMKLVIDSCRKVHACDCVHMLISRNSSCFPRSTDRVANMFMSKWMIAREMVGCYNEAVNLAKGVRKEKNHVAVAAIYGKAQALVLQAADLLQSAFVSGTEEVWRGDESNRILRTADHVAGVADDLAEAVFSLSAVSTSIAASAPVVSEAVEKLSLFVTKCAESVLALDLSSMEIPVGTDMTDFLPLGFETLSSTCSDLQEAAPRLAYYQRQADSVDSALSPAHERMADCWRNAAEYVSKEIAVIGEQRSDPAEETRLRVVRLFCKVSCQLATGMLSDSAEMYVNAARDAGKPWAEQWARAADLMLGAAVKVESALLEKLHSDSFDSPFWMPDESLVLFDESRAMARAAQAAARKATIGIAGASAVTAQQGIISSYASELELAYSRLVSGMLRPKSGCLSSLKDFGFNAKDLLNTVKALLARRDAHQATMSATAPQGVSSDAAEEEESRCTLWVAENALVLEKFTVLLFKRELPDEPGVRLVRLLHSEIGNALASLGNPPSGANYSDSDSDSDYEEDGGMVRKQIEDDWEMHSLGDAEEDEEEEVPPGWSDGDEDGAMDEEGLGEEAEGVQENVEDGADDDSDSDSSSEDSDSEGGGDGWGDSGDDDDDDDDDSDDDGSSEEIDDLAADEKCKVVRAPIPTTTTRAQSMEAARLLVLALEACHAGDALAARLYEMAARCMSFYYAKQPFAVQRYLADQVERRARAARTGTAAAAETAPLDLTAEESVLVTGNLATLDAVVDALANTAECRLKAAQHQAGSAASPTPSPPNLWKEAAADYLTSADERLDVVLTALEASFGRSERLTTERSSRPERTLVAAQSYRHAAEAADSGRAEESECWAKVARLLAICDAASAAELSEGNAQEIRDAASKAAARFRRAAECLAVRDSGGGFGSGTTAAAAAAAERWLEAARATESLLQTAENGTIFIAVSETYSKDTVALADYLASAAEAADAEATALPARSSSAEEGRSALWAEVVAQQREVLRFQREAAKLEGVKGRAKGVAQLRTSETDARRKVEQLLRKLAPPSQRGRAVRS